MRKAYKLIFAVFLSILLISLFFYYGYYPRNYNYYYYPNSFYSYGYNYYPSHSYYPSYGYYGRPQGYYAGYMPNRFR